MTQDGFRLSVLLPAHNEANTIADVLRDYHREVVHPLNAELMICEDGSTDGTDAVLRNLMNEVPFRLVSGPDRKGYASAVRDGLRQVATDWVFFSDSDGQYDPRDFWRLEPFISKYDMVIGRKVRRPEPLYRVALAKGFNALVRAMFDVPLSDIDCGFRVIRRNVIKRVLPEVRFLKYSFWGEFTIQAHRSGFRILEVPISHRPRLRGNTSIYPIKRLPFIVAHQLSGLLKLSRNGRRNDGG